MDFGEERSPAHCEGVLVLPKPLWGVFEHPVHPFGGALPFSEQVLGLLRKIRKESLNS
jgi:hypothetical protein